MLKLNVSYKEKDIAKKMGAKWDPIEKSWMAPGDSLKEYKPFKRWIDGSNIIRKEIYIVEASRKCWKCNKETPVICFATRNYYDLEANSESAFNNWVFTSGFSQIPDVVFNYVQSNYNFKLKYSRTIGDSYHANCCKWCDSLQGNNYLFFEPFESPFYVHDQASAQKLLLHKIPLKYDFPADFGDMLPVVIGSGGISGKEENLLIEKYSNFKNIDLYTNI